jgi:Zn-finger nucleic acid-binding protein
MKEVPLDCPRCHTVMRKIKKHDVVIDVCNDCGGLWLDDGEIDKLVTMGKQHGKEKK